MKYTNGINLLRNRNIKKNLSKKILLANTSDKVDPDLGMALSNNPLYIRNNNDLINSTVSTRDIRYNVNYGYSPIVGIEVRNYLLMFAENQEIKKAIRTMRNEIIISNIDSYKYPVFPKISFAKISEDKQETAKAIQTYLDEVFYPKMYQLYRFKGNGLADLIEEYLKTGKIAFEIVYDNPKNPKEIVNFVPIDPASLQKFKDDDYTYFIQRNLNSSATSGTSSTDRILHENQVILIEWNEYDFGYVSYADQLRRPFNIMRSMQTSKIMWFAVKSQVRMHIKLALGDLGRQEALQKLSEFQKNMKNEFAFDESNGTISFNNSPNINSYQEYFTAETVASQSPEIEEINTQGPDLTEVDSLQFWEKKFWQDTEIPLDRIDPNASDGWGFNDVTQLKKTEINFAKYVEDIRNKLTELFIKPIIIQLTLQELEIGIDLSLLDSIEIEWVAFNKYEKLAELEVLDKKISMAMNFAQFGEMEDVNGTTRKLIPITWMRDNWFDFTPEQLKSMEMYRKLEDKMLGFSENTEDINNEEDADIDSEDEDWGTDESEDDIASFDDDNYKDFYQILKNTKIYYDKRKQFIKFDIIFTKCRVNDSKFIFLKIFDDYFVIPLFIDSFNFNDSLFIYKLISEYYKNYYNDNLYIYKINGFKVYDVLKILDLYQYNKLNFDKNITNNLMIAIIKYSQKMKL